MVLTPKNREELSRSLADASQNGVRIETVHLSELSAIIEHKPEDMTATVEAGMKLTVFQDQLRRAGQWLPIDPPNPSPFALTIGDLLAYNFSGPRRFGYGTIRDYLIGIRVALANGEVIKAGGKVVKNVAGYDLCKLFVGAKHTLGIIVEATFKLRPLPEAEVILGSAFGSIPELQKTAKALLDSAAEPVLLDASKLCDQFKLVTGFAGAREDVEYQAGIAQRIAPWTETTPDNRRFPQTTSVLPSRTAETLIQLNPANFVARLGNGVIYHDCIQHSRAVPNPMLTARVKNAYDPRGIFPEYTL
jgi:FAD/FMN-containing dehydrogenase